MKNILIFILIFVLTALLLCGCANSAIATPTTKGTHTTGNNASSPTTDNTNATANSLPLAIIDNTNTTINQQENGENSIYLSISGETLVIRKDYEAYIPYISEEMIKAAELILTEAILDQKQHSGIYLTTDQEGYLCLALEIIVSLTPPSDGNYNYGGCGIDHKHVFHRQRISTQPIQ